MRAFSLIDLLDQASSLTHTIALMTELLFTQTGSFIELQAGNLVHGELLVIALSGKEEVSRPFEFQADVATPKLSDEFCETELLGANALLTIRDRYAIARVVYAVIDQVRVCDPYLPGKLSHLRLRLVPRLKLAHHRVNTRIFQDQSLPEIVSTVLKNYQIECVWNLTLKYPTRTYCVQYNESDLAFVHRLLAQCGIAYFIQEQTLDSQERMETVKHFPEKLVLFDHASIYVPIEEPFYLPARSVEGMLASQEAITQFSKRRKLKSGAVTLRNTDFEHPSIQWQERTMIEQSLPARDERTLEQYDHHNEHEKPDISQTKAKVTLEQLRRKCNVASGQSNCKRLMLGHWFFLEDHPIDELNRKYAVTKLRHQVKQHHLLPDIIQTKQEGLRSYLNYFECVPHDQIVRPKHTITRTFTQSLETAAVVGPENEEIYTDEYGRVKVQFHWDREGKKNEHSSCWIRVSQSWSGAHWGFQFIPRVGTEVLVSFLGADQDRPVITGCLYNIENMPPYSLPEHKHVSGIKTKSTPHSDGFNELRFEDSSGKELIYLHAQKDRESHIEHDDRTAVAHNSQVVVQHNRLDHTVGKHTIAVGKPSTQAQPTPADFYLDVENHARIDVSDTLRIKAKKIILEGEKILIQGNVTKINGTPVMVNCAPDPDLLD